MLNVSPVLDRIIIKRSEITKVSSAGIVLAHKQDEKADQGVVVAVGPGKRNENGDQIALTVEVGDRVLFGKHSGQTVKIQGEEYLVMKEDELYGIVIE